MTIVIIEDAMNKIFRYFIAVSVAAAGALFLIALVTGEGNAALPASSSTTSCVEIKTTADEMATDATETRHQLRIFLHLVTANPECFTAKEVATARATLDRLATQ